MRAKLTPERTGRAPSRPGRAHRLPLPPAPELTPTGTLAPAAAWPPSRDSPGRGRQRRSRIGDQCNAYAAAQRQRAIETQLVAARHSATLDSVTRTPAGRLGFLHGADDDDDDNKSDEDMDGTLGRADVTALTDARHPRPRAEPELLHLHPEAQLAAAAEEAARVDPA